MCLDPTREHRPDCSVFVSGSLIQGGRTLHEYGTSPRDTLNHRCSHFGVSQVQANTSLGGESGLLSCTTVRQCRGGRPIGALLCQTG